MEDNLKKDLISFLAESIYEGSDSEYILNEFCDAFIKALNLARTWKNEEENND